MPIVNASDGKDCHMLMPFANVYQVSMNPVEAIIAGNITSLEELRKHAPQVVSWLKHNLSLAHTDENIKSTIKAVLGAPRFASNLEYFGLWEDLIEDCKRQALEIGQGMKTYYDTHELSVALGETAIPSTFGKFQMRAGENQFVVEQCSQEECARRQDECMHPPESGIFPQNVAHSQVWNEKCFIHVLRMVAMAIDLMYQEIVQKVCEDCCGSFRNTEIKGFVRMKNKCVSKEDHYDEAYPRSVLQNKFAISKQKPNSYISTTPIPIRPSLNIDINRNACTFKTPKDLLAFIDAMKKHPSFGWMPGRPCQ
jgi:hypothetical protein